MCFSTLLLLYFALDSTSPTGVFQTLGIGYIPYGKVRERVRCYVATGLVAGAGMWGATRVVWREQVLERERGCVADATLDPIFPQAITLLCMATSVCHII